MKCSVCKSVSDTYDPYLDIALEIRVRFWLLFFKALWLSMSGWWMSFCPGLKSPLNNINSLFLFQQAANIVRALELFVKPDVLSGENAYMCAKWVVPQSFSVVYIQYQPNTFAQVSEALDLVSIHSEHVCISGDCSALVVSFLALDVRRKFQRLSASQFTEHQMCWHCHLNGSPTSVEGKLPRYQPTHATATQTGL